MSWLQKDVLDPKIADDLEILRPYLKDNDACASEPFCCQRRAFY